MPLFDFACSSGHVTEVLCPAGTAEVTCPRCERTAARQISRFAMAVGDGIDWSSPVRDNGRIRPPVAERMIPLRQYREATEQLAYEHDQAEESAQRKLDSPPLARIAIKRARQLLAAGVTDSMDMPKQ